MNKKDKKHYLNFKKINFVWRDEWFDPELIYKGKYYNYYDIEDNLYDYYTSNKNDYESETGKEFLTFKDWCKVYEKECYEYIDDIVSLLNV